MIALEMKGWIEARHGSGLYVTRRDHGSGERADALNFDVGAFDLTEARILFEGEAVALPQSRSPTSRSRNSKPYCTTWGRTIRTSPP